ncbi:MAG: WecB/TagA/CpsF family glycosyltransferase [Candidatus Omnitrophica bacterium]|nr:WecB/TagA/CpsF family glycosyltransferase [Candidatus Omnitrophota bacterium]
MMKENFQVLGVRISAVNLKIAARQIEEWIENRTKTYVCVAPVSTVMDCQDDARYRTIVNAAGMVTPDGMPIVWIGRRKAGKIVERTYGPDLMNMFCALSEDKGYKHYFYGGSSATNRLLVEALKRRFPKLAVVGQYAPAFLAIQQKEQESVLKQINNSGADVLWVGLGSPKQDYWMALHREEINVPVMIGAGAAFDFLAGTKAQAPLWMQRSGLEWVFRLCCEPRRLWRRYLVGNMRFIFLIIKNEIFKKSSSVMCL